MQVRETENALSAREHELIDLAADGLTDQAIAHRLGISVATVGTYWGRVRIKIGPYSRTELVAKVIRREQRRTLDTLREENEHLIQTVVQSRPALESGSWQDVLEDAPDAIILVTKDGGITYGNKSAEELFGYTREELSTKFVADLVPDDLRARHRGHIADYMEHPERKRMGEHMATPAMRKDGAIIQIQATLAKISSAEAPRVMCCIRRIDED